MKYLLVIISAFFVTVSYAQLERSKGENGKWGFMDNEKWIIQPVYDDVTEFYHYKIAGVKQKGKWGFIDRSGQTVLPFIYSTVSYNDETNSNVTINGKYGMINLETGAEVIKCIYDKPIEFEDAWYSKVGMIAMVVKSGKTGMINMTGKEMIPCLYDYGSIMNEDSVRFHAKINKRAGMIDITGKQIVPCKFDFIVIDDDGFISTKSGKKKGLYSNDGREIAACIYDNYISFEPDGYASVMLNKKVGLIDKTGKLVLPIKYGNDDEMMADREALKK